MAADCPPGSPWTTSAGTSATPSRCWSPPSTRPAGALGEAAAAVRDFDRWHEGLTEPWDGPAGLFTDGAVVGATLDRNGLRPMRWEACADGLVVCASEAGAVDTGGRGEVREASSVRLAALRGPDPRRAAAGRRDQGRSRRPAALRGSGPWSATRARPPWSRGRGARLRAHDRRHRGRARPGRRYLAAGMSGGELWLLDPEGRVRRVSTVSWSRRSSPTGAGSWGCACWSPATPS